MNKAVLTPSQFYALGFLIESYDPQQPYTLYTRLDYCVRAGYPLRVYNALCNKNPPLVEFDPTNPHAIHPTTLGLRTFQEEQERREQK